MQDQIFFILEHEEIGKEFYDHFSYLRALAVCRESYEGINKGESDTDTDKGTRWSYNPWRSARDVWLLLSLPHLDMSEDTAGSHSREEP
jgi:hypothetical protein